MNIFRMYRVINCLVNLQLGDLRGGWSLQPDGRGFHQLLGALVMHDAGCRKAAN